MSAIQASVSAFPLKILLLRRLTATPRRFFVQSICTHLPHAIVAGEMDREGKTTFPSHSTDSSRDRKLQNQLTLYLDDLEDSVRKRQAHPSSSGRLRTTGENAAASHTVPPSLQEPRTSTSSPATPPVAPATTQDSSRPIPPQT